MVKPTRPIPLPPPPSYTLDPSNPDAIRLLKHAIGLARIRGDAKAALGYAEKRKQFLNWIEDERAREGAAIRAVKALPIARVRNSEAREAEEESVPNGCSANPDPKPITPYDNPEHPSNKLQAESEES